MNDFINGMFGFTAGVIIWLNIIKLSRDKVVRGYQPSVIFFFVLWDIWFLYYYPSLDQWVSFLGAISVIIANIVWLFLVIYYRDKK